jgi:hypothetical protein
MDGRLKGEFMYTEQMTQRLLIGAPIPPQQLTTTTTVNSGSIDFQKVRRGLFHFQTGVFGGTSPTLSAVLQLQESSDNATWSNNATIPSFTLTNASQQATLEINTSQLGTGKRYVRLQAVCTIGGTSPTIPISGAALGDDGIEKPARLNNDASIPAGNQTVVN